MSNYVINLATEVVPPAIESKKNHWVEWGADNNYFNYLRNRYLYSPTNNTVINNFVKLFQGNGLTSSEKGIKPEEWARVISVFNSTELEKLGFDFKAYGQCAMQVLRTKGRLTSIKHIAVDKLRLGKRNSDGEIESVWYCENWLESKKYKPEEYSIWTSGNKDEISIAWVGLYTLGEDYYSLPDYYGALPYTILEEEISDYLINDVRNGFSGTSVINFNSGIIPDQDVQDQVALDTVNKVTGSKGKKVIVSFNPSNEQRTTIDSIPLNDAPSHYEYLSNECVTQILKGHNVTSGLLFGITSANGFSSNADELKNAFNLYQIEVLTNYHNKLINKLTAIFSDEDVMIKLNIEVLNPFGEVEKFTSEQSTNAIDLVTRVAKGELTSEQAKILLTTLFGIPKDIVSNLFKEQTKLSEEDADKFDFLSQYADEDMEGWKLYDSHEVVGDVVALDNEINEVKLTLLEKVIHLASTGTARSNAKSSIDGEGYKIRYRYAGNPSPQREFCKLMMGANKVYRLEDIKNMGNQAVNAGFGVKGADKYSILNYKGGARCKHFWLREIYVSEGANVDVNSPLAKKLNTFEAQKRGIKLPIRGQEGAKPNDMPYHGYTEEYYTKTFNK